MNSKPEKLAACPTVGKCDDSMPPCPACLDWRFPLAVPAAPLAYSPFITAVTRRLRGISHGVSPGIADGCAQCPEHPIMDGDCPIDEGRFSGAQCDSCGSRLAGDRFYAHAFSEGKKPSAETLIHLDICIDCVMFHANGDEPEGWDNE